ncbi:MAG: nuclear transport factor 2 family protein [Actinobacteria bacterium]|nr:nuclear transport factor 2 family protein [Actinomycetota bacterium]
MAWLSACEEIRQLASRYAVWFGVRDTENLARLFVPDVKVTRETAGTDALRASFDGQMDSLGRVILMVGNHVIDATDHDNATGIVSCRGEIEDAEGQWIIHQIQYHDVYRRVNGRWLFVRRRHLLWYGHDMPNPPVGLADANWPRSQTGRGELPECIETWRTWSARKA